MGLEDGCQGRYVTYSFPKKKCSRLLLDSTDAERTKTRPLAAGDVTQFGALTFLGAQLTAGLAVLTQLNWYSIALGASSLGLVVIYPFMKRITYFPQVVLGFAFNWGALLGWSAVAGAVDWTIATPMYLGGAAWCVAYDIIYAHQVNFTRLLNMQPRL